MTSPAGDALTGEAPRPGPHETLDHLSGDWRLFQLRRGHRFSTDDVLTAWCGLCARPQAARVLELGAGTGSVGLMVLQRLGPAARLTSVEVQQVSVELLRKTLAYNGLEQRVQLRHGDLRHEHTLAGAGRFDLVLANPPYLPPHQAKASPHPQRAAARLELHGDVFDYCRVAARHLAPGGCFCFSHAHRDPRPERAVAAAGLTLLQRRAIVFRHGAPPMIALYTCAAQGAPQPAEPLAVRGPDGERSEAYRQVRRQLWIEA